jgi:hypothetical protein
MSGTRHRANENGPGAAATAHRAKDVVFGKPMTRTNPNRPVESSLFDVGYGDHLWRFALGAYKGRHRLSVWQHYKDRATGEWKPCGGRCRCGATRESPGFFVPPERFGELLEGLAALQLQILPSGRSEAA